MVSGGVVGVGLAVRVNVDEGSDRDAELVVESMLDTVGGVVSRLDGLVGVDRD